MYFEMARCIFSTSILMVRNIFVRTRTFFVFFSTTPSGYSHHQFWHWHWMNLSFVIYLLSLLLPFVNLTLWYCSSILPCTDYFIQSLNHCISVTRLSISTTCAFLTYVHNPILSLTHCTLYPFTFFWIFLENYTLSLCSLWLRY